MSGSAVPSAGGSARISSVGVVAKSKLHAASALLREIAAWLAARGVKAVFERETAALASVNGDWAVLDKDQIATSVDLVLVLGGDGTLLSMADRIAQADADTPILGINFGSLGFLTEVTLAELYSALEAATAGTAPYDQRLMLRSTISRGSTVHADRIVLNDVVITRGALSRIIEMSVWVGGQFVTRVRADGIIIASPTGSTAYNLASGGPIVHPSVEAVVLTPIAPHTLAQRPIVIPASSDVRIEPHVDGDSETFVTLDGQSGYRLLDGDTVTVTPARRPLRLIRATTRSYFAVLREKLKWGER